ncbi:hypothetical protein ACHAWX_005266 [Stephanocyclus meneghinianus]
MGNAGKEGGEYGYPIGGGGSGTLGSGLGEKAAAGREGAMAIVDVGRTLAQQSDLLDDVAVDAAAGSTAVVDYTLMAADVFDVGIFVLVDCIPDYEQVEQFCATEERLGPCSFAVATVFKSTIEKFRSSFMLSGGSGVLSIPSFGFMDWCSKIRGQ